MHQHQHGPNCHHGHGHGAPHSHQGMAFPNQVQDIPPEEYFKQLRKKYSEKRVFFWQQILMGLALDKVYEKYGFEFMRSFSCNTAMMIIGSIEAAISFEFIPKQLRHFTSGLFFPILFLLFFNFNVAVGIGHDNQPLRCLIWAAMATFALAGLRGSGELNSKGAKEKSKQIYTIRPYLQNPNSSCSACSIVKFYRSMHCPFCKSCVTKHTRHSIVFGVCIGAANEFLCLTFFLLFFLTQLDILYLFFVGNSYGIITKVMFYLMNGLFCWMGFSQFMNLLIFNIYYGITQGELKTWMIQQYLIKVPEREFQNNVDQGCIQNLANSFSAAFGIPGYESQNHALPNPLAFPPIDPNRTYRINWAKARYYLVPLLPCHKNRQQIQELLQREQPRMIEMYKLQQQFRDQIIKEPGNENLNEFQLQQKLAMKMQAHVMKNMPQMMMGQPSTEQQRTIQLQMLAHMKKEFASQPDLAPQIEELHAQLSESHLTPIEANMRMRQLQQELMQRRMSKVIKQHQEQPLKKREEQEEAPMAGLADEEL